jgi:hypothetical protein
MRTKEIARLEMTNKKIVERSEVKEPKISFETSPANRSNNYCERLLLSSYSRELSAGLFRDDVNADNS